MTIETVNLRRLVPRTEMRPPMTMDTATERTGPIGTLILITDDEMRDILTHIAGAGDRVLFDRLRDRWTSLRYGTRSGPEVPARGRVVGATIAAPTSADAQLIDEALS